MNLKKIKRAIISVSNKSNLNLILPILKKYKIEIISSGGTFKKIQSLKYKCIEISDYTEFKTMLDGRIKTLHPKIYAGILNIRKNTKLEINDIDSSYKNFAKDFDNQTKEVTKEIFNQIVKNLIPIYFSF